MSRIPASRAASAALLLAVSLATCLAFIHSYPPPGLIRDDIGYMALARGMAQGSGFSQDGGITPAVIGLAHPDGSLLLRCRPWRRAATPAARRPSEIDRSIPK